MRDRQCALNHDATESLSLSQMCHKQTDHGRLVDITCLRCHKQTDDGQVVYITCIPTTCCGEGEIFLVHNVEIVHVTLTTPT